MCYGECSQGENECIANQYKYCDKQYEWQTKVCNTCDTNLGCFSECPDIFLGPNNWNGATSFDSLNNPAIVLASTSFTEASPVQISVELQNRGNRVSTEETTFLELYWSVPTTGFMATSAGFIGQTNVAVPASISVPPSPHHGSAITPFYWTPDIGMGGQYDGNYTLLARVSHIQALPDQCPQQTFDTADPQHDERTALRNVHIVSETQAKRLGDDSDGMAFAFAAANNQGAGGYTVLAARALTAPESVPRGIGSARFVIPSSITLHRGHESVVVPDASLLGRERCERSPGRVPMLHDMGQVSVPGVEGSDAKKAPGNVLKLWLGAREMSRTVLKVAPRPTAGTAFAIKVEHRTRDGEMIGSLIVFFTGD